MNWRILLPATCTAAALLALTSCNDKTGTVSSDGSTTTTAAASATAAARTTTKPKVKKPTTAAFGATYTYSDHLAVTVSKVAAYTPSQYAAGTHAGDDAIILTVKIRNGTKKAFDTSLVSVNVKAGTDGAAADQIFDERSGEGFRGTIVPGSTASAKFAFDIPKGAKGALDIEVQPDSTLEYASWHWVGKTP
jgi:hypothetical protein